MFDSIGGKLFVLDFDVMIVVDSGMVLEGIY